MADSSFDRKGLKKPPTGSLALRVFLVSLICLVVPILFHSYFMYRQEYRLNMYEFFLELELVGSSKGESIERLISLQQDNLTTIAELSDLNLPNLSEKFQKIIKQENISSLFYLKKEAAGGYSYAASSHPEWVGKKVPFDIKPGQDAFLGFDPLLNQKVLFIMKPVGSDFLGMGVLAEELMQKLETLEEVTYHIDYSLLTEEGTVFFSTAPNIALSKIEIFEEHEVKKIQPGLNIFSYEEDSSFYKRLKKGKELLGLKIPIEGSNFFLLIDIQEKAVTELQGEEWLARLTSLLFFIVIIGGGGTLWITYRMSKPLKSLTAVMDRVGSGDLSARYKRDAMGFEINVLGENFNEMIESLLKNMEVAKNERVARELLAGELQIGQDIQKSLYPKEMPKFPGVDIAAGSIFAKEVGGDFYDLVVKKDTGQLMLSVADAAGKGISACLYSLGVRSILRSYNAICSDLSEMVRLTNNVFYQDTEESSFFATAWIGIYDAKTRLLQYSCCGHQPAILKRKNGEVLELTTNGIALGAVPLETVKTASIELMSGDVLLLYTDGLVEAHDIDLNLFGKKRLMEILKKDDRSAKELIDRLLSETDHFATGAPQHDDLTLLALRIL